MPDVCLKIVLGGKCNPIYNSGGNTVVVVDNLLSTSTTSALSANQGRLLAQMAVASVDIIKEHDNKTFTDKNVLSSLRTIKEIADALEALNLDSRFLSKLFEDTAAGRISFDDGFDAYSFVQGQFLGAGLGAYKDENENSVIETDKIIVRKEAIFNELIINQIRFQGGIVVFSAANLEVSSFSNGGSHWEIHFDTKKDENGQVQIQNQFVVGDQIRCQRFSGGNIIKYYMSRVTSVGEDFIRISKDDYDGIINIAEGDAIVQFGHRTDVNRQSLIEINVLEGGKQTFYQDVNSYNLTNKNVIEIGRVLDGSTWRNMIRAYGDVYFGNRNLSSYFKFNKETGEAEFKGKMTFKGNDGGEQDLSDWVDLTDSTLNGLEKELSITLSPDSVTLPATSTGVTDLTNAQTAVKIFKGGKELFPDFDESIGGRNLYLDSKRTVTNSNYVLAVYEIKQGEQFIAGEDYTVSLKGSLSDISQTGFYVNVQLPDLSYPDLTYINEADRGVDGIYRKTFKMPNVGVMANADRSYLYSVPFGNNKESTVEWIKIEKGSKATDWTPAPEELLTHAATITPQNCSAVITDINTLKITSVNPTADFGAVDLTVEYGGNTAEKRFSFAKAKAGTNGTNGTSGVNSATILLYKRATSTPSLSDISNPFGYRFSTGEIITGSIGAWSRTVPAGTNPLYVISAHVQSVSDTISVYRTNFSTPTILVKDGTNGVGIVSVIPEYFLHTSGITAPHNLDMGWTSVRPAWEDNKYLWSRFTTTYTNGLMAYTTPVLDLSWNIEIGGVNLVRNGNFMSGLKDWSFGNGTEVTTKVTGNALPKGALSGLQIANGNVMGGIWQNFNDAEGGKYQLEFGKQYTLSFLVKWISGSKQLTFGYENLSQIRTLTSGWEALQYTFTPQSAANLVFYMPKETIFQITNIQLERGNKRTDFKNGYLERALKQDTEINGGLVLSSVVAVRDDDETVTSYISGLREDENGEPMSAFAAGVKNFGQENESKMIDLRHDGSGHLAGGKFSWDEEGEPVFKGDKELHEVRIRTKPIDNFATMVSKSRSFIGFPGSPANPYGNGRSVTSGGQFSISSTLTSNTFTMDLPGEVWLNLTVTAKQNLPVVPNPSTIDCVCSVQIINNVNEEVVYTRSQSSSFQLKREKVLLPPGTYRISIYAMYGISAGVYTQGYIYTSIQWGELSFTYDMNKNHIGTDGIAVVEDDETYFYLSLTDLEWLLRARGKQRYLSQDGLNGMEITNDGVKVSGKTDIPGVLLAGYVSSGGGLNGYWGKKKNDAGAAWTSQGKYTVYHSVNHSDYFVVVTSRVPTRIPFVISKYSTYFTVEIKDQANTYQDASFDFVIIGDN